MNTTPCRAAGEAMPSMMARMGDLTMRTNDALMMCKTMSALVEQKISDTVVIDDQRVHTLTIGDAEILTWAAYHAEAQAKAALEKVDELEGELLGFRQGWSNKGVSDPTLSLMKRYHNARKACTKDAKDASGMNEIEAEIAKGAARPNSMAGAAEYLRTALDENAMVDPVAEALARSALRFLDQGASSHG